MARGLEGRRLYGLRRHLTTVFMAQPVLKTLRLKLVPLSPDHLNHVIRLDSDPDVARYIENGRPLTPPEATAAHERRLDAAKRVPGLGHWAGFLDDGDCSSDISSSVDAAETFVGWWSLAPIEAGSPNGEEAIPLQADLGYRLLPAFWRRGLAKEGARELVRHGFADLGLARISAETMAVNAASRATMAAAGLRYVRTFHVCFEDPIPGTEEGEVEYAVTRGQWLAR